MKWDTKIGLLLLLVLVLVSLQGCSVPEVRESILEQKQTVQQESGSESGSVPDFQGIANALGCVFAPDRCNKKE